MKLLIASDLHGDAAATRRLTRRFDAEGADRLLLLGDLLYHGPRNPLPESYAPREVIELLSPLADRILTVRGNCDTEVDQMVLPFPILAPYCLLAADGLTFFATHGHLYNPDNPPPLAAGDLLLCGHTHVPAHRTFGRDNLYINPGSVSMPKENSPAGYMIYEAGIFTHKTMDGDEISVYRVRRS